jgi:hypothetical protein
MYIKKVLLGLLVTLVAFTSTATASEHESGMKVIPVETYACKYNEGKGPEDLEKVITMWTNWANEQGLDNYAAWTLTPYYFGPQQEFDVIWLGAGKDAVSLGAAQDMYLAKGGEIAKGFSDVLNCDAHGNFASLNFNAPPEGSPPNTMVVTFSDCSYKEGASFEALSEAMGKWAQHLTDEGSETAIFHWYPAYGGGAEKFDFKWLQTHENFAALGKDYDNYGTGGGWKVNQELFNGLVDCDSTRAYIAKSRRHVQLR